MDTRDYYYDIEFIFIESRYFIENKDQKIDKLLNKPEEINIFIRDIVEENTLENMKKKNVMLFYKNIGKKDTNIIKLELYNNKLQENIENIIESTKHFVKANKEFMFDAEHFFDGYKANSKYA